MANHIEDKDASKTGVLKDPRRRELKRSKVASAEERYLAGLAYVMSAPKNGAVTNADIESLYQYLDAD